MENSKFEALKNRTGYLSNKYEIYHNIIRIIVAFLLKKTHR